MKKILEGLLVLTMCVSMVASFSLIGCKGEAAELSGDVVYWSMWNETEPQAEVIKAAINDFEAANPEANVVVQWSGRDIRQIIKAALDAGENIDIFENDPEWLASNLGIDYSLKLDDYFAKTYATTGGEAFKDTLVPVLVTWISSLSEDQGLYYIPNQAYVVSIFYGKDVFQNAGIDEVPQTWSEFLDVCEKLKTAGVAPITVDDAYWDLLMGQYLGLLKGQEWVSQLMQDETGAMWKDPAVAQFAEAFEDLYNRGYISENAASNKYPAGQQQLALEKAGMYLNGSWLPNELSGTTGPDFNWGVFAFPNIPNAAEDNTVMMFGSQSYAISKNSENADAAFELITYIVNKETQSDFSDVALSVPVTLDTKWPEVLTDVKPIFEGATGRFSWACGLWDGGDLTTIALNEFAKLISGSVTAEKFVTNMEAVATK